MDILFWLIVFLNYGRSARWIGETRDDLGGDRLSLDSARSIGMWSCPNTLFKTFESQRAFLYHAVTHREAASSPFADLALDNDIVIETARHNEPRSNLYDWQTDNAVFLPHG
jgi:hypothetical protein